MGVVLQKFEKKKCLKSFGVLIWDIADSVILAPQRKKYVYPLSRCYQAVSNREIEF